MNIRYIVLLYSALNGSNYSFKMITFVVFKYSIKRIESESIEYQYKE